MAKENKTTAVPKLRFPEFSNMPAWQVKPLEALVSPVVREREKPAAPYTGLGVRSHGKGTFLKPLEAPEKNSMECLYEVREDDLIVNITFAWEGAIAVAQETDTGALVSHRFPTYTFNTEIALPDFFRYTILDKQFIYQLGVISPGGAGRNRVLNKRDFLRLARIVPTTTEQQKIADCLTSLDKVIAAQGRKVETLKTHKRGLMQQLFPREGEMVPRLRFPEFRSGAGWVLQPFSQLYEFKATNTFSRDQLNYRAGKVRNIHYGDIHTKFAAQFRLNAETVPFINPAESLARFRPDAYCQVGDIVFADSSEDLADVGKSIEVVELNGEPVLSGSHTVLARQKQGDLVIGFGAYLLKARNVRAQIEKEAHGTKVLAISPKRLASVKICFPHEKAEQQRITDCLSPVDTQIVAESEKLTSLKIGKKGLMQQLFPSPSEV